MRSVRSSRGLQGFQRLECRLANTLVPIDPTSSPARPTVVAQFRGVDRNDLPVIDTLLPGAQRPMLRLQAETVAVGSRNASLVGNALGRLELAREFVMLVIAAVHRLPRIRVLRDGGAHLHA